MTAALITALVFTVILLVITAYFLMGSVPLLVLKHDTPLDAAGAAGLAVLTIVLRRAVLQRRDALRAELQVDTARAVGAFRRTHIAAILANLAQPALIVWSLVALPLL